MGDLADVARARGILWLQIAFTDLFGVMRAKLVSLSALEDVERPGAGFVGDLVWLDREEGAPTVFAVPDPASLTPLPWRPDVAWVASDLFSEGTQVAQAPRATLARVVEQAQARGWRMRHGVECEFFLLTPDGLAVADAADAAARPGCEAAALMRRFDVLREIADAMEALGWGPCRCDHEGANGQFEINWSHADARVTADRHAFFKYMVRVVAERHGLRASFMPKPFPGLAGNGCHAHVSLWSADGTSNLFLDGAGPLSRLGLAFVAGVMRHAPALTAIAAPTVNSYKRLNAARTASGGAGRPGGISYGGDDRRRLIRIPAPGRFELRLGDGATNPYLYPAAILAAGMASVDAGLEPGGMDDAQAPGRALPQNLLDALRALKIDTTLTAALGQETVAALLKLRHAEWRDYCDHFTEWERTHTLDC